MALFEPLFKTLNDAGVRYVVVGGLAVVLHGHARLTVDVDLASADEHVRTDQRVTRILRMRLPCDPVLETILLTTELVDREEVGEVAHRQDVDGAIAGVDVRGARVGEQVDARDGGADLAELVGGRVTEQYGDTARRGRLVRGATVVAAGIPILLALMGRDPAYASGPLATVVLPVLNGAAWTALGYALWSHEREAVRRAPRTPVTAHD